MAHSIFRVHKEYQMEEIPIRLFRQNCPINSRVPRQRNRRNESFIRDMIYESIDLHNMLASELPHPFVEEERVARSLGTQMLDYKREVHCNNMKRKQIYERSPTIRLWLNRFDEANIYKTVCEQKAVVEKLREEAVKRVPVEREEVDNEFRIYVYDKVERKSKEKKEFLELQRFHSAQIREHELNRERELERVMRDRKEMTELTIREKEEDENAIEEMKASKINKNIEQLKAIEEEKNARAELRRKDEEGGLEYLNLLGRQETTRVQKLKEAREAIEKRLDYCEKMGERVFAEEKARRFREDFIRDFIIEEKWFKDIRQERLDREKSLVEREAARIKALDEQYTLALLREARRLKRVKRTEQEKKEVILDVIDFEKTEAEKRRKKREFAIAQTEAMMIEKWAKLADDEKSRKLDEEFVRNEEIKKIEDEERALINLLKSQPQDIKQYMNPKIVLEMEDILKQAEGKYD